MKQFIKDHERGAWLAVAMMAALLITSWQLTHSGLWFDETIEYWYSKQFVGSVPGGRNMANMYELIVSTYQPPLYNFLMHFWLLVFDSEWGFRFFGVLMAMISAVGFYQIAGLFLKQSHLQALFAIVSISLYRFVFYMQECAEYCVLLCALTWMTYFTVKVVIHPSKKNISGFFLLAIAAMYSQYGAAFIITGCYTVLLYAMIRYHREYLRFFLLWTLAALVVAAAPLILLFLLPQYHHQHANLSIVHEFVVNKNIFYDIAHAFHQICRMTVKKTWMLFGPVGILCLYGFIRSKEYQIRKNQLILAAVFIALGLYYLAVKLQYFGYTAYGEGFEQRYSIIFIPFFMTAFLAVTAGAAERCRTDARKWMSHLPTIFLVLCIAANVFALRHNWDKGSVRAFMDTWFENYHAEERTIVAHGCDAGLQFYLLHDRRYRPEMQDTLISFDKYLRNPEDTARYMDEVLRMNPDVERYGFMVWKTNTDELVEQYFTEHGFVRSEMYSTNGKLRFSYYQKLQCSGRAKFAKLRRSKIANSGRIKTANLSQSKRANHRISTAQIGCSDYGSCFNGLSCTAEAECSARSV